MSVLFPTYHWLVVGVGSLFLAGVIHRMKAIWGGRKGQPLGQLFFDLQKLCRKDCVYSETTSWVFRFAPVIVLATALLSAAIAPIIPGYAPVSFEYDFVFFAYLMGLGRVFLILGALDTGSAFEGMGASREATYSAMIEPALLVTLGTLSLVSGHHSFVDLFLIANTPAGWLLRTFCLFTLLIVVQIEASRIPVDDPNTHLELTMIHEVMLLDHSGIDLAFMQLAAALKLTILVGIIAALLNPYSAEHQPGLAMVASLALMGAMSVLQGLCESWVARFRLKTVPTYAFVALVMSVSSLIIAALAGSVLA